MKETCYTAYFESPIGWIEVCGSETAIMSVDFVEEKNTRMQRDHPYLQEAIRQLGGYFQGRRKEFALNLLPEGTEFQQRVWNELLKIPYGQTVSYHDIALALGDAHAVRAVGHANGKNPLAIVVPCHRVIGRDGRLTGYGGGIWRKEWLLQHEGGII